jgi:long-subunit acyl-CoA synthetase (AMP-forming)
MAGEPAVREAIETGVAKGNEALSRIEQIKKFELIAGEWEPGGDELTPTLKLKRKPIGAKYESVIDGLYGLS